MNLKNRNQNSVGEKQIEETNSKQLSHLQHFRQNLHKDPLYHKPYSDHKHGIYIYQLLFVLMGTIISLLGFTMIFQTPNWMSEYFFLSSHLAKNSVVVFALSLGVAAFAIAFYMRTENEVAKHMQKRARKKLQRIFRRKHAELSFKGMTLGLNSTDPASHSTWLDLCLRNALDQIDHAYDENHQLLRQIHSNKEISDLMREKLYNQALVELKTQFERIIRDFLHQPIAGHLDLHAK